MIVRILSIGFLLLLGGCYSLDRPLSRPAVSSCGDEPVPIRWDAKRDKWVVDVFELERCNGDPVPIRWDAKNDEWTIDVLDLR